MRFFCRQAAWIIAAIVFASGSQAQAQILVTDYFGRLISYDPGTNTSTTINSTLAQPSGMTLGSNGLLYVSNAGTNTVDLYNPTTGAFISNVISSATLGPSFQPTGVKFGPGGDLFVSSQVNQPFAPPFSGGVSRFNLSTQLLTPVITGITQGEGLLYANNNLYVAELNNYSGQILKYDFTNPASVFIANDPGNGGLAAATGMTVGPDGFLYVTDVLASTIRRYNINNPGIGSVFISSNLVSPTDLVFDSGHLYVSNVGDGSNPNGFLAMFDATTGAFQGNVVTGLFFGSAVVAVPEPSSLLMLSAAGAFMFRRFRRK